MLVFIVTLYGISGDDLLCATIRALDNRLLDQMEETSIEKRISVDTSLQLYTNILLRCEKGYYDLIMAENITKETYFFMMQ